MKIELTVEEYNDLLTCIACGVSKSREWLINAMNDEFSTPEDVEHYDDVERRFKALQQKLS